MSQLIVRREDSTAKMRKSGKYSVVSEIKVRSRKSLSLSELNKIMERDRISDEDPTVLIRKMRYRKYDI